MQISRNIFEKHILSKIISIKSKFQVSSILNFVYLVIYFIINKYKKNRKKLLFNKFNKDQIIVKYYFYRLVFVFNALWYITII